MVNYMAKDKRRNQKRLEEMNELYKQYILQMHGQSALDRLEMEWAVLTTNKVLETRTTKEFERMRREYE